MTRNKAARSSGNYSAPKNVHVHRDVSDYTEYERGTRWAAYAFCAMFAFLLFGVVMFGW